ncbi:tripartite tricarboxylate transporter substrate binding protein [Cupriavidus basilensis]|nr:tripartite tricarboxylate transporter substrate binding protein [Cupriavidus basilensis]MCP3023156.1 tripartite tricarboxylate transporter substrate binding protein [Cupriavidus basilensis]
MNTSTSCHAMLRRLAFALLLCLGLANALAAPAEDAQRFPVRPITLIVPWPAGGATDISMRVLAELAGRELGQPIVVENKPGAGGTLVGGALAAARPDGYTIGQLPLTVYRFPHQQKTAWQPLRDIQPVLMISGYTFGIVVPADSPFHTLDDLIAWGRAHPGALTVGSTGIGTTAHLAMEDVLGRSGVRYVHVPYRGTADQMLAVANGSLMAGVNSTGFAPFVDSARMRLLAVFSAQRSARWPEVPTVSELGFDHAIHNSPYGIGVPRGTDPLIVSRLHDAFRIAMYQPRHVAELAKYDQELSYLNTARYEAYLQRAWDVERRFAERVGTALPKEHL